MREIYIILGWVGWIWLGISMVLLALGMWVQHTRQRKGMRGVEINGKNTKQS
jgi:hypothetical protein